LRDDDDNDGDGGDDDDGAGEMEPRSGGKRFKAVRRQLFRQFQQLRATGKTTHLFCTLRRPCPARGLAHLSSLRATTAAAVSLMLGWRTVM